MRTCPKCKKQTVLSKYDGNTGIGSCASIHSIRMADAWSMISEKCTAGDCNYMK